MKPYCKQDIHLTHTHVWLFLSHLNAVLPVVFWSIKTTAGFKKLCFQSENRSTSIHTCDGCWCRGLRLWDGWGRQMDDKGSDGELPFFYPAHLSCAPQEGRSVIPLQRFSLIKPREHLFTEPFHVHLLPCHTHTRTHTKTHTVSRQQM